MLLISLLGLSSPTYAQITPDTPFSSSLQFFTQSWQISDDTDLVTARQNVMPLTVYVPIVNRVETRFSSSFAKFSTEDQMGIKKDIQGFTDLKIQTSAALLAKRNLVLGIALNLPTGNDNLDDVQQNILQAFSSPDLSIRENRFGVGFNAGTTVSYAHAFKNRKTLVGGAIGYVHNGKYNINLDNQSLNLSPGAESTVALAFSHTENDRNLFVSPSITHYGIEQWNGADAIKIGPKVQLQSSYSLPISNPLRMSFGINQLLRFAPKRFSPQGTIQDTTGVLPESTVIFGAEYRFMGGTMLQLNQVGRFIQNPNLNALSTQILESNFAVSQNFNPWLSLTLGQRFIWGRGKQQQLDRTIRGNEGFLKAVVRF